MITFGASREHTFPETVKSYLDGRYPGWVLKPINRDAEIMFREQTWRGDPNWHWGDFNGDAKTDYVVALRYKSDSGIEELELALIALGDHFSPHVLAKRPASENRSLFLPRYVPPEEQLLDTMGHAIAHPHGAVEVLEFEKEARAYVFHRKSFSSTRTR